MLSNPHLHNLLLLIGSVFAYNMEGHDDPAWLFLVIFLIFWGWWKDIKVIATMIAMTTMIEEVTKLYSNIDIMIEKVNEKVNKKTTKK